MANILTYMKPKAYSTYAGFPHFKSFKEVKKNQFACPLFRKIVLRSEREYNNCLILQYRKERKGKIKRLRKSKGQLGLSDSAPLQLSGRFAGELTETVKAVAMRTTITLVSV